MTRQQAPEPHLTVGVVRKWLEQFAASDRLVASPVMQKLYVQRDGELIGSIYNDWPLAPGELYDFKGEGNRDGTR